MRPIQYIAVKEKERPFRVVSAENFKKELGMLPAGRYQITVEKARKKKSNQQLAYYYAGVLPIVLRALNDAGWEFTDTDQVDEYLKSMFASTDIVNRDTAEIMTIPALKRDMSTTEMMTFINAIRDWCSEYLNTYVPEPAEQITMEL